MHDDRGNAWFEDNYEGYGVFAGLDFYALLARMNGLGDDRAAGINLAFSKEPHKTPNLTRHRDWEWINEAPENDPNQGWGESHPLTDQAPILT